MRELKWKDVDKSIVHERNSESKTLQVSESNNGMFNRAS